MKAKNVQQHDSDSCESIHGGERIHSSSWFVVNDDEEESRWWWSIVSCVTNVCCFDEGEIEKGWEEEGIW